MHLDTYHSFSGKTNISRNIGVTIISTWIFSFGYGFLGFSFMRFIGNLIPKHINYILARVYFDNEFYWHHKFVLIAFLVFIYVLIIGSGRLTSGLLFCLFFFLGSYQYNVMVLEPIAVELGLVELDFYGGSLIGIALALSCISPIYIFLYCSPAIIIRYLYETYSLRYG
ncbi:MAG TPA: hypothetical protein VLL52_00885 [Anaerolineae bacterium]|nr:hypothetical protein [Anaerolineae bacterium]